MANENGYVVYPDSIQVVGGVEGACAYAKEQSAQHKNEEYRVEDCDTEKTLARYRNGEEVAR